MKAELAEEASNLRARLGFQGAGWVLLVIVVFGVLLPWQKGRDFLDAVMLGAYACLGVVFAAPVAGAEFERSATIQKALARIVISVFYGEVLVAALLTLGIATVYVSHGGRIVVGPDLQSLAECAALGLTLSWAVCTAAVWISLSTSPRTAKTVVRLVFLTLLAAFYFRSGWLPTVALRGSGIALLASILFVVVLRTTLSSGSRKA